MTRFVLRSAVAGASLLFCSALIAADNTKPFAEKAASDGIAEVELANLALERAASNEIKTLANQIKQDHQHANDQLKALAAQKGVAIASETNPKHQREKERLSKLTGKEFDNAYIMAMIKAHEQDIKLFERQAKDSNDADMQAFASSSLPTLQAHLDHARQVHKGLQAKQ